MNTPGEAEYQRDKHVIEEVGFENVKGKDFDNTLILLKNPKSLERYEKETRSKSILNFINGISSFEALEMSKKSDIDSFFISNDTTIQGKPQAIVPVKIRLNLAHKIVKDDKTIYKFLHQPLDGRELRANCEKSLTHEFYLYRLASEEREFVLLSPKKLEIVEQKFKGMALHSASATEVTRRFSLRGFVNLYFVSESIPNVRLLSDKELLDATSKITKQQLLDYLFYHDADKRIYRQPEDYQNLLGVVLFSGKYEGYPLHLITMGGAGLGKTKKQESISFKFAEPQGIFEASSSRLKGLIPSFKEKPASLGYLLSCNRIALVDELLKMLESTLNEGHFSATQVSNFLQQLNPILEHKIRTISSGNDNSFVMSPTAKLIADCNPLSGKYTIPEHLKVIDYTTLSRTLFWVVDGIHSNFVKEEKGKTQGNAQFSGDSENTLTYNDFLSIYDTLNSRLSKIDLDLVSKVYRGATATLHDSRLNSLWNARGLHHCFLIIDGVTKLRCLFENRSTDFVAQDKDYDSAQKLIIRLLQTMQSPVGGQL